MVVSFDKALKIAQEKYPHRINHYEEYKKYFVFVHNDGIKRMGGDYSPIVIRKSDAQALNYAPIFFNLDADAEDVGEVISEGSVWINSDMHKRPDSNRSLLNQGCSILCYCLRFFHSHKISSTICRLDFGATLFGLVAQLPMLH